MEDGDTVEFGDAVMTFREIDAAERAALERRRTAPGRFVGPGGTLLILSLFQAFLTLEFTITAAQEYLCPICLAFFARMVTEWCCYLVTRSVRRTGFEPETLAFFLTTLGTAVCATATPEDMFKQTVFIILGVALYFFLGAWLRSLERVKSSRFIAAAAALGRALYWGATLRYLPATILTILAFGFWRPVTIALMIVYPGLEKVFKLEETINARRAAEIEERMAQNQPKFDQ